MRQVGGRASSAKQKWESESEHYDGISGLDCEWILLCLRTWAWAWACGLLG